MCRYGLGAIGITMIITSIITEFAIIVMGLTHLDSEFVIKIGFISIVEGGVVAAGVLITFGVVLGKVSQGSRKKKRFFLWPCLTLYWLNVMLFIL